MFTIKLIIPKSIVLLTVVLVSNAIYADAPIHVGSATTVVNDVFTTVATGETRVKTNDDLFFKQQVLTKENSTLTVTFRDNSTFSVAPQSVVVLDEFVFNPSENVLDKTVNIIKGSFRYISGFPIKNSITKIVTPFGTAGIRGSAVQGIVNPTTGLTMNVGSGVVDFQTKDGKISTIHEGESLSITASCTTVPSVPASSIANSMQYLDSSFGKAPNAPLNAKQILANAAANNLSAAEQRQAYLAAQNPFIKLPSSKNMDTAVPNKTQGDPQQIINSLITDLQTKNKEQVDGAIRDIVGAMVANGLTNDKITQIAINALSGAKIEQQLNIAATILNTLYKLNPTLAVELAPKVQQALPEVQQFELPHLVPNITFPVSGSSNKTQYLIR